jgi:hypothetical protein
MRVSIDVDWGDENLTRRAGRDEVVIWSINNPVRPVVELLDEVYVATRNALVAQAGGSDFQRDEKGVLHVKIPPPIAARENDLGSATDSVEQADDGSGAV